MSRAGYATAGWSGNPLVSPRSNFDQGFDRFSAPPVAFRPTREFLPEVVGWIRENRSQRFFLYLQLVEAHFPYDALPEFEERFVDPELRGTVKSPGGLATRLVKQTRVSGTPQDPAEVFGADGMESLSQLYDACVATFDAHVGELLDELEALGLTDDTLVVVTADHGEELFDRGFLGHGYSVLDEQTHVPLILAGPGVPSGARQSAPVGNRQPANQVSLAEAKPVRQAEARCQAHRIDRGHQQAKGHHHMRFQHLFLPYSFHQFTRFRLAATPDLGRRRKLGRIRT